MTTWPPSEGGPPGGTADPPQQRGHGGAAPIVWNPRSTRNHGPGPEIRPKSDPPPHKDLFDFPGRAGTPAVPFF